MRYEQFGGMNLLVVPRADFSRPWAAIIVPLCEAQNWRCCYCGIEMMVGMQGCWDRPKWDRARECLATIEHVTPKVAGGSNRWENLVAACRLCNNARSAMKAERYARLVKWKGREKAARYAHRLRAKIQRRQFVARLAAAQ